MVLRVGKGTAEALVVLGHICVCSGCHSIGLWSYCVGASGVPQITTTFPGYLGASWGSVGTVVPGSAVTGDGLW